jgi:N-acetylneuraminate synthase
MDPRSWRDMVDRTRELELSLGTGIKRVEANEVETVVLQRRGVRAKRDLEEGTLLQRDDLAVLRPCPTDAIDAAHVCGVVGRRLRWKKTGGDHIQWNDLE